MQQTAQRIVGHLHILDATAEKSEAVLPLPKVIWRAPLEHQERQQAEPVALAEV
ncbi:hypothetical protein [Plantactinospora sp. WMMB782]|uniref:hypothetical protein n=1 Tax=Plantactinospora sp. WMMB782 TaxID=3404121 RepID=UPI003B965BED